MLNFQGVIYINNTLPKTNSSHLAGGRDPKRNSSEQTPVFQVRAVSFREGIACFLERKNVKKFNMVDHSKWNVLFTSKNVCSSSKIKKHV